MRIDLATLDFPLLRTQQDVQHGARPEQLAPAQAALLGAEHIVIVFSLWLGTMPALVKAFLEQVMRAGVAFRYHAMRHGERSEPLHPAGLARPT